MPVLSVQMTEVQPRVSTEGRLLTMAFLLAILRVPVGGGGGVDLRGLGFENLLGVLRFLKVTKEF